MVAARMLVRTEQEACSTKEVYAGEGLKYQKDHCASTFCCCCCTVALLSSQCGDTCYITHAAFAWQGAVLRRQRHRINSISSLCRANP